MNYANLLHVFVLFQIECKYGASCRMLSPQHNQHTHHCTTFNHPPATIAAAAAAVLAAAAAAPLASLTTGESKGELKVIPTNGRKWNAPWYHPQVRAWRSELAQGLQDVLTKKMVPGLSVSYMAVITGNIIAPTYFCSWAVD
jgi:hypothetical protein